MLDVRQVEYHKFSNDLTTKGYARLPEAFVGAEKGDIGRSREDFLVSSKNTPVDKHNSRGIRRRRFGKFVYLPASEYLESLPPKWNPDICDFTEIYSQSTNLNPDQGGKPRLFCALLREQYLNVFLRHTIGKCAKTIPRSNPFQPEYVNVHVLQLVATPNQPGISSPPVLHRDGEFFTFAFLLDKRNVIGGENVIGTLAATNKHPTEVTADHIVSRFTLEKPWEGYVVNDHKVSHFVDSVTLADPAAQVGWRTVLLVDFTPAIPNIPNI